MPSAIGVGLGIPYGGRIAPVPPNTLWGGLFDDSIEGDVFPAGSITGSGTAPLAGALFNDSLTDEFFAGSIANASAGDQALTGGLFDESVDTFFAGSIANEGGGATTAGEPIGPWLWLLKAS